jgi:hypothetical protein
MNIQNGKICRGFWLYGGWDPAYSDLWKFDPVTLEWTWVKGNGLTGQAPVHGTLGIPGSSNTPGQRSWCSATWVDVTGNLWLFGGVTSRNDLWKYDISTNEWTWMSGSSFANATGVYGVKGVPSPTNVPGARNETCSAWTDSLNNLWLFGGQNANGSFNDLWKYSIPSNEWTWMSGSNLNNVAGVYGTKGIPAPANCPGARNTYSKWKDQSGNFWLMGGAEWPFSKDDVWKFDPAINQWTWMAGTNLNVDTGVYQITCTMDSVNRPRARFEHRSTVTDNCGRFWMFGGLPSVQLFLNDLWVFDPTRTEWLWVSGTNIPNQPNNYGSMGVPAATNSPASRWGSVSWWGNDDRFYLFGGNNNLTGPNFGDLWVYTPDINCPQLCSAPVAAFSAPNYVCPGSCIDFSNVSLNATSYQWIFAGASISNSSVENPQNVCYNTPGNFDVTLIAYNSFGSDTITLVNYITVFPFPQAQGIIQIGDTLFANQGAVSYQWYFNGGIINGATNYFYVAAQGGDYNVICADSNGCEAEAVINDVLTEVKINSSGRNFEVHPNPATNELILRTDNLKIDNIIVLTITGKKVLIFEKDSKKLNISILPDGYYFIEARNGDEVFRSSFMKNSDYR